MIMNCVEAEVEQHHGVGRYGVHQVPGGELAGPMCLAMKSSIWL